MRHQVAPGMLAEVFIVGAPHDALCMSHPACWACKDTSQGALAAMMVKLTPPTPRSAASPGSKHIWRNTKESNSMGSRVMRRNSGGIDGPCNPLCAGARPSLLHFSAWLHALQHTTPSSMQLQTAGVPASGALLPCAGRRRMGAQCTGSDPMGPITWADHPQQCTHTHANHVSHPLQTHTRYTYSPRGRGRNPYLRQHCIHHKYPTVPLL